MICGASVVSMFSFKYFTLTPEINLIQVENDFNWFIENKINKERKINLI